MSTCTSTQKGVGSSLPVTTHTYTHAHAHPCISVFVSYSYLSNPCPNIDLILTPTMKPHLLPQTVLSSSRGPAKMSLFRKNVFTLLVECRLLVLSVWQVQEKKILFRGCMQQTYGDSPHPSPHHAEPPKTVASATTNNLLHSCCTDTHMPANYMRMNFSP